MPCGTSSVLSTTPATTSLPSHPRRYDLIACRPGNHPSTFRHLGRAQPRLHPLLPGKLPPHPPEVMPVALTEGVPTCTNRVSSGDGILHQAGPSSLERPRAS